MNWCQTCRAHRDHDEDGCIECWMKAREQAAAWGRMRGKATGHNQRMQRRRERLKALGRCINGLSHPLPMPGYTKCAACVETHRRSR